MTSTSVNIGFAESKNSSRVLKPPGGGHSDIFGVRGDNELQNQVKRKTHPPTSITSCFVQEEEKKNSDSLDKEVKKDLENGNQNGTKTDDVTDENTKPTKDIEVNKEKEDESDKDKGAAPPRRVRVPPGGFSSGLW